MLEGVQSALAGFAPVKIKDRTSYNRALATLASLDPLWLVMGLSWSLAYLGVLHRGACDRTCAMPFAALCANLAWETVFTLVAPMDGGFSAIGAFWLGLDLLILGQAFCHGWPGFDRATLPRLFPLLLAAGPTAAALGLVALVRHGSDYEAVCIGAGFSAALLTSLQFLGWVLRRRGVEGQSLWIGAARWLGTAASSVAYRRLAGPRPLLDFLYVANFVCDSLYLVLVRRRLREAGVSAWRF